MSIVTIHSRAAGPSAHRTVLLLLAKARRTVNGWVAIYIARHEQRAMAWAMHVMNQRQLKGDRRVPSRRSTSKPAGE